MAISASAATSARRRPRARRASRTGLGGRPFVSELPTPATISRFRNAALPDDAAGGAVVPAGVRLALGPAVGAQERLATRRLRAVRAARPCGPWPAHRRRAPPP